MGIFNFLFGRKKAVAENDDDKKDKNLPSTYSSAGTVCPPKASSGRSSGSKPKPQGSVKKATRVGENPDAAVDAIDGCEQICFKISVPDCFADKIPALGSENKDYNMDVLALRRKGYLFCNVYAYNFCKMDADLIIPTDFHDDPDAVLVSANGVGVGYLTGSAGARMTWLLQSGLVRRAMVDISGGDYITLECDPEYDETSKRIPKDCLYTDADNDKYSVSVFIDYEKRNKFPAIKHKAVFQGVNTKALPGCKQQRIQVSGEKYHMDAILSLGKINNDYLLPKDELHRKGLINVPIPRYVFPPLSVRLLPEPSNEYDKNAIQVLMNGILVGYIPRTRCVQLLSDMASGKVIRVQGGIDCGDIRMLCCEPDPKDSPEAIKCRVERIDGGMTAKVFLDILSEP